MDQACVGQRQLTPSARQAKRVQACSRLLGAWCSAVQSRTRQDVHDRADGWKTTSLQEPHNPADTTDDDYTAPYARSALRTYPGDLLQDARSTTARRAHGRTAREPTNGPGHRRSDSWDIRREGVVRNNVVQAASTMVRT